MIFYHTTAKLRQFVAKYDSCFVFSLSLMIQSNISVGKWNKLIHEQAFQSFIFGKCDQTNNNSIYPFKQWNLFRFLQAIYIETVFCFCCRIFCYMPYDILDPSIGNIALYRCCQFHCTNSIFLGLCIRCVHNSHINLPHSEVNHCCFFFLSFSQSKSLFIHQFHICAVLLHDN